MDVAENDGVSVGKDGNIGVVSGSGQGGSRQSFLGYDAASDKADAVIAVLRKCQNVFRFNGNGLSGRQFVNDYVLSVIRVIGDGITAKRDFHQRKVFPRDTAQQRAEGSLPETSLGTQQDFFEFIILAPCAVTCDKRSGFGKKDIVAAACNF